MPCGTRASSFNRAVMRGTLFLLLQLPLLSMAAEIHVDQSATGGNNGSTWADAYTDLQDALSLALPGDEIWVAAGVYTPTSDPAQRTVAFQLRNGVGMYGGFSGTESLRADRDWQTNTTILSGDIENNDASSGGVVTDTSQIQGANSLHVLSGTNVDASTVLDGFTITAGYADGSSNNGSGAGLILVFGSPTLNNLQFSGNFASIYGGAIYSYDGAPVFNDVTFLNNRSSQLGGAIASIGDPAKLSNIPPILTVPEFDNVIFMGNRAAQGGAMFNSFGMSPALTNTVFFGNIADNDGGAIYNRSQSSPTLINTTLSGNSAAVGGGLYNVIESVPTLVNSIAWGNTATAVGAQIHNADVDSGVTATYSLVEGQQPLGDANLDGTDPASNPLFVDQGSGDLRLQADSPAVDAGSNAAIPAGVTSDLSGGPRILPAVDGVVDLGAFETAYFLVTPDAGAGGQLDPASTQRVAPGGSLALGIIPDTDYRLDTVNGCNGTLVDATYTTDGLAADCTVTASFVRVAAADASPTGSGPINVQLDGGGTGCGFVRSDFVSADTFPPTSVETRFPHGLFDFELSGCDTGSTVTLTMTYPTPLPSGAQYWKFGPTADNPAPHWYVMPASFNGADVSFSITDGGMGDGDLTANGSIVDPGGPGLFAGSAAPIPSLQSWSIALLALLLGWFGVRRRV
ncbi:IPTL-CTERM sorting domain-containing protein [Halopseudomonas salegens]|uniref:IPTL-CTERM protein sorting domain-containing protein n=1 Tax=Halopseudomonas salegens TaxID=1434072 RepID=A0A1H2F490_9GAMM|nr:IPTL-CTERM sorting domain-containing protein [Halopseudomonas salegens]SDU02171.1 IPTL-CTERM protein sorting domain-containing protein [Halopseudomonas salegens]